MEPNRRQFIEGVGVMLAGLLATRCAPALPFVAVTPTPAPPTSTPTAWDRLRKPWHDLDRLAQVASDSEQGGQTKLQLINDHRAALDELVSAGELAPAVADEMQAAFAGAAYHVWLANSLVTCYEPAPGPDYDRQSSSDLVRQADLLAEMAGKSDIDPVTVAQAQTAIQRDVVYLAMTGEEQHTLRERLWQTAGETWDLPALAELDLDIPPESAEAARILVELLLEQ
jgi:hypothetical protein